MNANGHNDITVEALSNYSCLNSATGFVQKSNNDADNQEVKHPKEKNIWDGYNTLAQHSNNTSLSECSEFIKDAEKVTAEDFIEAAKSMDTENEEESIAYALYDFGRLSHSIQDFYSHTNWINLTGAKTETWDESANNKNIKTTDYNGASEFFDKYSFLKFNTHYSVNKDEYGTPADKAFKKKTGVSGYDQAYKDAVEHTTEEWTEIDEALKANLDKKTYEKFKQKLASFDSSTYNKYFDECRENFNDEMKEELT